MSTTVYYFSGTGNSLAAARGIADKISGTQLVNIAELTAREETEEHSDTVGIVFPVYFEDIPDIVKRFVERLAVPGGTYVFGVATCGYGPGWSLYSLDRLLRRKGTRLSAGFAVTMPDNAVIVIDRVPPPDVQESVLASAAEMIVQIAEDVKRRANVGLERERRLRDKLEGVLMKALATRVYRTPKRFTVTDACVRCGTCKRICPTGNIDVRDGRVSWGKDCAQCLACLHWCPAGAISLGRLSQISRRYHHPDVSARDMMLR